MTRLRRAITVFVVGASTAAAASSLNLLFLAGTSGQGGPLVLTRHVVLPSAPPWTIRPSNGPIGDRGVDD